MATEDFTTYTEVDPNSHLTQTAARSTYTGLTRSEVAYLYKDYGVAHFNASFRHNFDFKMSSGTAAGNGSAVHWALTNTLNDMQANQNAKNAEIGFWIFYGDTTLTCYIEEVTSLGNSELATDTTSLSLNVAYFGQAFFDSTVGTFGTLYIYVYPTATDRTNGTNKTMTLTGTLTATVSFRYLMSPQSWNHADTANTVTGYVENLDLSAPAPAGTTTNISTLLMMGVG